MEGFPSGRLLAACMATVLALPACSRAETVTVRDRESLRQAVQGAKPGDTIRIAPGEYAGGLSFSNLHGTASAPIRITADDPKNPPLFKAGGAAFHFSQISHIELRDLRMSGATGNGLNIDDGGNISSPSHHITLRGLSVSEVGPQGNRDGIKLSGIDDFQVLDCKIERWGSGGSGIDMVGCHRGVIQGCTFRDGGSEGVQAKGGSSQIIIRRCRFDNAGGRAINAGGSTGMAYFRPKVQGYEAKDIRIEGNVFVGGMSAVAFVGVDGATVRFNTIYRPGRWAFRILQETQDPGFVPSRGGVIEDNIIVFQSDAWSEGGVNIGPGTAPETFRFARNVWYCGDRPDRSRPRLPTAEVDGVTGKDPLLRNPEKGDFALMPGSPAQGKGATSIP
jgi:hypothetical protein